MLHADDLIEGLANIQKGVDISYSLGQRVFANVTTPYPGVNIRGWYELEGVMKPCSEGMTLHKDTFDQLVHVRDQIERAF
jgi:hypothetical protein